MAATLVGTVRGYFALGNVLAGVNPTLNSERGFVGVARNGDGDYTLTLQSGLTLSSVNGGGVCQVTAYGATPACISATQLTATTLKVVCLDNAGVALDCSFGIAIVDVGPN